jgi:cytochrome bd-type quinol oxidase subunit 2
MSAPLTVNIAEIDNDNQTTLFKTLFVLNGVLFALALASAVTGIAFSGGEDYKGANIPMMHLFYWSALGLLIAFVLGVITIILVDTNSNVRKAQKAAREAAQKRLEGQYSIAIAWHAIRELWMGYSANDQQPDVTHLARFDSMKADGSPASYALRLNAVGDFEVFGTSGVEWVAVAPVA